MDESTKGHRSVEQVRRLLAYMGFCATRLELQRPPGPDVLAEIAGRKIGIETTDYHGGEQVSGGSNLRKREEKDVRDGRPTAYWVPIDPLPGLTKRIEEKSKKRYETSGIDEVWLAIFAGVPQHGAVASTFMFTLFLNCEKLHSQTDAMLRNSQFSRCYLFCGLTAGDHPVVYLWTKADRWHELK